MTNVSGRVLSREQMKQIKGGVIAPQSCAGDGVICHQEGGLTYTCSTNPIGEVGEGKTECCCGHSAYNWVCEA